eukprot:scaffold231956_cov28-Tisochrysis_lutea.AAC.2
MLSACSRCTCCCGIDRLAVLRNCLRTRYGRSSNLALEKCGLRSRTERTQCAKMYTCASAKSLWTSTYGRARSIDSETVMTPASQSAADSRWSSRCRVASMPTKSVPSRS